MNKRNIYNLGIPVPSHLTVFIRKTNSIQYVGGFAKLAVPDAVGEICLEIEPDDERLAALVAPVRASQVWLFGSKPAVLFPRRIGLEAPE